MSTDDIMSRFLILEDHVEGTWCVIHGDSGILVADSCPTYHDAFVEAVRVGSKIV